MINKNTQGQNISQSFIDAITDSTTPYEIKLLINGVELNCDIKRVQIVKGSVGDVNAFGVGAVVGSQLSADVLNLSTAIKGEEIEVQAGLNGEFISLGLFTVAEAPQSTASTSFTGYGACIAKTKGDFTSPQDMTPPQALTIANIITEIEAETGVTVSVDSRIDTTAEYTLPMNSLTTYQALQAVVASVGAYATDTADGNIAIKLFDATPTSTMSSSRMRNLPKFEETDFEVTGVKVYYAGGEVSSTDNINLTATSQYMTLEMFPDFEDNIVGYRYRPANLDVTIGDPRLEGDDVLTVTDSDGNSYVVPCHQIVHTFTGGLTSKIVASVATRLENDVATPKPISSQVQEAKDMALEALEAVEDMGDTSQYFWHTTTDTGAGAGSHITQIPQVDFLADPTHGGGNTLIDSDGMIIREGLAELAKFRKNLAQVGMDDSQHLTITAGGLALFDDKGFVNFKVLSNGAFHEEYVFDRTHDVSDVEKTFNGVPSGRIGLTGADVINRRTGEFWGTYVNVIIERQWSGGILRKQLYVPRETQGAVTVFLQRAITLISRASPSNSTWELLWAFGPPDPVSNEKIKITILEWATTRAVAVPDPVLAFGVMDDSTALGSFSSSFGKDVLALGDCQTVLGKYNNTELDSDSALVIGNGTDDDNRSNAFSVLWNGTINSYNNSYERDTGGNTNGGIQFRDKNGKNLAYMKAHCSSDGQGGYDEGFNVGTSRVVGSSTKWNTLQMLIKKDGSPLVTMGQPEAWRKGLQLSSDAGTYSQNFIVVDIDPSNFTGRDTSSASAYYLSLVKYICTKYPNMQATVFKGNGHPASLGNFEVLIYDTSDLSNGVPRYCTGFVCQLDRTLYTFGTNNYTWGFNTMATTSLAYKTSVTNVVTVVANTAKNSSAVSANGSFEVKVVCKAPDGYQIVGVGCVSINNANCISRGFDVDGYGKGGNNTVRTFWRALSAISANGATVTVQIMCIKIDGVS